MYKVNGGSEAFGNGMQASFCPWVFPSNRFVNIEKGTPAKVAVVP